MTYPIGTIATLIREAHSGSQAYNPNKRHGVDFVNAAAPVREVPAGTRVEVTEPDSTIPWVRTLDGHHFPMIVVNEKALKVVASAPNHRGETFTIGDKVRWSSLANGTRHDDHGKVSFVTAVFNGEGRDQWVGLDNNHGKASGRVDVDWLSHFTDEPEAHPDLIDGDLDRWVWSEQALNGAGGYVLESNLANLPERENWGGGRTRASVEEAYGPVTEYIADAPEPVTEANAELARPTVVLPEGKTRDNARSLFSHVEHGDDATVLTQAADGLAVDAQHLDAAVTKALSNIAADVREKRQREPLTSAARSILHRTSAVINNHLDQLPTYEPGERSPRIRALNEELAQRTAELETERRAVADLRAQRTDRNNQVTAIRTEVEAVRDEVIQARETHQAELARLERKVDHKKAQIVEFAALVHYLETTCGMGAQIEAFRAGRKSK